MKLYTMNGNNDVVTVDVIKETPKGYKVDPETCETFRLGWHVPKFIKKFAYWTGWQPASIMAIKDMREILKKRILMVDEEIYKQEKKKSQQVAELKAFDERYQVVSDDGKSEESFWMELQREGKSD